MSWMKWSRRSCATRKILTCSCSRRRVATLKSVTCASRPKTPPTAPCFKSSKTRARNISSLTSSRQSQKRSLRRRTTSTSSPETTCPFIFGTCVIISNQCRVCMLLIIWRGGFVSCMRMIGYSISLTCRFRPIPAWSWQVDTSITPTSWISSNERTPQSMSTSTTSAENK